MKNVYVLPLLGIYVLILITYHRFENSEYALQILGNIPTFISTIATVLALIIALKTYLTSLDKARSKTAYDAYKESLINLSNVLANEGNLDFKIYSIGVCFDSLAKIEPHVTEKEHRDILSSSHFVIKNQIKETLNSLQVNDFFNSKTESNYEYVQTISSCADAMCKYWHDHIAGKSYWSQTAKKQLDLFAIPPFSIDEELLEKAFALIISKPAEVEQTLQLLKTVLTLVTSERYGKYIEDVSRLCPLAFSFILLKVQTDCENYKLDEGKPRIKLKTTYDNKFWLYHKAGSIVWAPQEIPTYFQKGL